MILVTMSANISQIKILSDYMEKITFKETKNIEKINNKIVKEETIEEYISSNGSYIAIHLVNGKIHKRFYGVIGETYKTKKEIGASDMHYFRRELFKGGE